jgi:hypothetical protein
MYKNNSRVSSKFKGFSPLQLSCNLTGMKPAIGYYSYTKRYRICYDDIANSYLYEKMSR